MSDQLKELDLWWIVSGREKSPDKDSTDAAVQAAYNKHLRKCFRITAKIRNAMEPRICAQYTSAAYDEDPESLWKKLEEGYRKALGLELYYFRRSLFECTFDPYRTAAEYVHEIERIIECLREAEEEIKPREKTFYLLNGLPASWREWRDLQATILKPDQPEDLIAAIKARESTMNRDKGGSTGNDAVLAVRGKGYGYGSSASGSGGASSSQTMRGNGQASYGQSIVCYYCQKKGHRRSECRKLKSDTAKGIRTEKVTTAAEVASTDQAKNSLFTSFSSTRAPTSRHQWLLDRGCSTHVTGLRDCLPPTNEFLTANTGFVLPTMKRSMRSVEAMSLSWSGMMESNSRWSYSGKRCCTFQLVARTGYFRFLNYEAQVFSSSFPQVGELL